LFSCGSSVLALENANIIVRKIVDYMKGGSHFRELKIKKRKGLPPEIEKCVLERIRILMFLVCLASRESTRILSHGKSGTPLPPVMILKNHNAYPQF